MLISRIERLNRTKRIEQSRNGVMFNGEKLSVRFLIEEADEVWIHIDGSAHSLSKTDIEQDIDVWSMGLEGQFHQKMYIVEVIRGDLHHFSIDPWAVSTNTNSQMGVILDLERTNPSNWKSFDCKVSQQDTVLYEAHVRDFTVDDDYGSNRCGAFNRFADMSAKGIPHLMDLGVTHLHLLPLADYTSVDDEDIHNTYNWGYDPFLFNVPEGSYSSNPEDGAVRVKEMKQMVQTLHDNGIAVVMDVVYNHTSHERQHPLHVFFPNIAYRKYDTGEWGNGSGCGNELRTEHPVIRQFIIDSLLYWQREYHIDGFRFDLMALYDDETMYQIERELRQHDPSILLYGEPWTGGVSALHLERQFTKGKQWDTRIALFNDEFRNGIKGDNDGHVKGLIAGNEFEQMAVLRGMLGSIQYNEWLSGFAKDPIQSINYVSAHDNLCLFDKIEKSCPEFFYKDRVRLNKFALSILLTSQGIPFLSQGTEFLHSKKGAHNSYNAGDAVNRISWKRKCENESTYSFCRDLIRFRKDQSGLRMEDANTIRQRATIVLNQHKLIGLSLQGDGEEDYSDILVIHNFNSFNITTELPPGEWLLIATGGEIELSGMGWVEGDFPLPYYSTTILVKL